MARATIFGTGIEYELHGREGDPAVALTPGGRFTMDVPGLRKFAQELVKGGRRVRIRPASRSAWFSLSLSPSRQLSE